MIEESFAANYLPYVTGFLQNPQMEIKERNPEQFLSIYNGYASSSMIESLQDAPEGSVAIINIAGAITKYDQACGPDGMLSKSKILEACYHNKNIKGIIIKIDSGGGEGSGMRAFCEALSQKNKPVVAFVDDMACSAAYGIASGCDYIVAGSSLTQIGSIGTYLTIADYEKYYENQGIKLIEIYATLSKDKNKPYYEAFKGNLEPLRAVCDKFNEDFLSTIEKNREGKLKSDRKTWGTGKVWFAEDALKIGLIDEINTFTNTLNSFV